MTEERAGHQTAVQEAPSEATAPTLVEHDVARALVATLPERGLDRMTPGRIESVLCTSALTAHI
jgi:hypothetical protein